MVLNLYPNHFVPSSFDGLREKIEKNRILTCDAHLSLGFSVPVILGGKNNENGENLHICIVLLTHLYNSVHMQVVIITHNRSHISVDIKKKQVGQTIRTCVLPQGNMHSSNANTKDFIVSDDFASLLQTYFHHLTCVCRCGCARCAAV
jgi:hypothetical protein